MLHGTVCSNDLSTMQWKGSPEAAFSFHCLHKKPGSPTTSPPPTTYLLAAGHGYGTGFKLYPSASGVRRETLRARASQPLPWVQLWRLVPYFLMFCTITFKLQTNNFTQLFERRRQVTGMRRGYAELSAWQPKEVRRHEKTINTFKQQLRLNGHAPTVYSKPKWVKTKGYVLLIFLHQNILGRKSKKPLRLPHS